MVAAKEKLLPEDQIIEIQKEGQKQKQRRNYGFEQVRILDGNIGYLELTTFSHVDQAGTTAQAAMQLLSNADAVILDLRENHGGSETMTQFIMSYFFGSEPVHLIDTYYREGNRQKQTWSISFVPGSKLTDTDLYILTSGRSASAAEEVAFNLKNLKRAVIVGETTRGAANPCTVKIIKGDILSQISIGSVANPETGATWEQRGVEPDITVKAENAYQAAYAAALKKLAENCNDVEWKKHLQRLYMENNSNY
jgi:C-terminal processing protease CtpA/Prc